ILLGFRFGDTVDMSSDHGRWPFFDKDTLPLKRFDAQNAVRVVPGGSTVRDGAYLGRGVICMPPMYINIGAWVGDGSLVDSHALIGSPPPSPPALPHAARARERARPRR